MEACHTFGVLEIETIVILLHLIKALGLLTSRKFSQRENDPVNQWKKLDLPIDFQETEASLFSQKFSRTATGDGKNGPIADQAVRS